MTKRPKRVQAPEGCASYLTAGKIYDVVGFWSENCGKPLGYRFTILDDLGNKQMCLERICCHLNGKDWIIVETETED
jgi:hypothetical protein